MIHFQNLIILVNAKKEGTVIPNFTINTLIVLVAVASFIISILTHKASKKSIIQAIDEYNDFVSDYNTLINMITASVNELFSRQFPGKENPELYDFIIIIIKYHTQKVDQHIIQAKKGIHNGNISKYRKNYKIINIEYEILEAVLEKLEVYKQQLNEEEQVKKERPQSEMHDEFLAHFERRCEFFLGCNTEEELNKRYKSLCKVYHPDMPTGEEETFKRLNNEYERCLRNIRREYEKFN